MFSSCHVPWRSATGGLGLAYRAGYLMFDNGQGQRNTYLLEYRSRRLEHVRSYVQQPMASIAISPVSIFPFPRTHGTLKRVPQIHGARTNFRVWPT